MIITTEKVWEEFSAKLKQFILKHVANEANAEDILQDVFLKIHTHIDSLRAEDKLQSWIYQIARNAIYDYYRNQKITTGLPETFHLPEEPSSTDAERELAPYIKAMVDCLPEVYRQALILTEYQGLTQRELADQLGLSFSGAKSRVQRAREKLKALLLECCHFEFDCRGRIIDYYPRCACCVNGPCDSVRCVS